MDYNTTEVESGALGALLAVYFIVVIAIYVVTVIGLWKMYVKAGRPGWAAIIPVYNWWVWVEMIGRPRWWFWALVASVLLSWIPSSASSSASSCSSSTCWHASIWRRPSAGAPGPASGCGSCLRLRTHPRLRRGAVRRPRRRPRGRDGHASTAASARRRPSAGSARRSRHAGSSGHAGAAGDAGGRARRAGDAARGSGRGSTGPDGSHGCGTGSRRGLGGRGARGAGDPTGGARGARGAAGRTAVELAASASAADLRPDGITRPGRPGLRCSPGPSSFSTAPPPAGRRSVSHSPRTGREAHNRTN